MSDRPSWSRDDAPWRPWQMDELGRPRDARPDPDSQRREVQRQQAFKRDAELKALREQAGEEARRQGYEEGFAAGKADGHAQGLEEGRLAGEQILQEKIREAVEPLCALVQTFEQALAQLDGQIAEQLVELALAGARQLAGEALQAEPEHILPIVRALLHSEPALGGKPRLWLHPSDLQLVREQLGAELHAAGWQLQPDALITRGGCRVTSQSGDLDATWESRWAAIARQVRRRPATPPADEGSAA
ncbi:flagellar assembly protein FliH [Azotobacter salinestris]|uniref:flagellar assembly protein FliH n=1 Tax=Azotobacter salinestris TaxID=69964 RepID=UPI0032DF6173